MTPEVICVGGANVDIRARATGQLQAHASNPGTVGLAHGGVARNVAEGLARLGLEASLVSAVGADAFGREILARLGRLGVDTLMVKTIDGGATGTYVAVLDSEGEMATAVNAMDIVSELVPDVLRADEAKLGTARFLFADCNLPAETLRWLSQVGPPMIVDPVSPAKAVRLRDLAALDVFAITPNRYQAEALLDMRIANLTDANAAARQLQAMGFHHVMLSLGPDGVVAAAEDETIHIAAEKHGSPMRDVTGAGDAAIAGLIFGLCQGRSFAQSCRVGQQTAAQVISGGQLSRELVS
jgi:pseudouridine kinase